MFYLTNLLFLCVGRTAPATTVTPPPTTVRHTLYPPFRSAGRGNNRILLLSCVLDPWRLTTDPDADPKLFWLTDPDPAPFVPLQDFHDDNKKYFSSLIFYSHFFFKGTFTSFLKDKKIKKKSENSTNTGFSSFFYYWWKEPRPDFYK
jgi:hypothetical protein